MLCNRSENIYWICIWIIMNRQIFIVIISSSIFLLLDRVLIYVRKLIFNLSWNLGFFFFLILDQSKPYNSWPSFFFCFNNDNEKDNDNDDNNNDTNNNLLYDDNDNNNSNLWN